MSVKVAGHPLIVVSPLVLQISCWQLAHLQVLLTGNVEDCAIGALTLLPVLLARFCK